MTGIACLLMIGDGTSLVAPTVVLKDVVGGANAAPYFNMYQSGAIAVGGNQSTATPAAWLQPVSTSNPGAAFYVKLTATVAPSVGSAVGTVLPMTGNPSWQWIQSGIGTLNSTATVTVYSDAGGANLVNSFTFPVTAQRTS